MFDIGFWEMLVIGVMGLLVLGPERLPGAIRSTMSAIRNIKDVANGFKQEISSQLDAHELHANLKKAESLGMENIGKDLQKSVNELKAAAASVQKPYMTGNPNASHVPQVTSESPQQASEKPQAAIEDSSDSQEEVPSSSKTSAKNLQDTVRKTNNE